MASFPGSRNLISFADHNRGATSVFLVYTCLVRRWNGPYVEDAVAITAWCSTERGPHPGKARGTLAPLLALCGPRYRRAAPRNLRAWERGRPKLSKRHMKKVSTASWTPPDNGKPLAMTSKRRSSWRSTMTLRSRRKDISGGGGARFTANPGCPLERHAPGAQTSKTWAGSGCCGLSRDPDTDVEFHLSAAARTFPANISIAQCVTGTWQSHYKFSEAVVTPGNVCCVSC